MKKESEQQGKELFEWVKAAELKEINWPLCIRYDGGGAYWYGTVCSMKELNSHVSEHNPISEIEYAKPVKLINQQGNGSDAVEFAEWLGNEEYVFDVVIRSWKSYNDLDEDEDPVHYSAEELYKLFKTI